MFTKYFCNPRHKAGHIGVDSGIAATAGVSAIANNTELNKTLFVLIECHIRQWTTGIATAGITFQITGAQLGGLDFPGKGHGARATRMPFNRGFQHYIRCSAVLSCSPTSDNEHLIGIRLLLQLLCQGQANGLNML